MKIRLLVRSRFWLAPFYVISKIGLEPYTIQGAYALHSLPLNDEAGSGRRDLNPQPQPWQGYALPLSYFRQLR